MRTFFEDKVVIVTGATDGIGLALVDILSGWNVACVACGKDEEKVAKHHKLFSPHSRTMYKRCDVSKKTDCEALVQYTLENFGRIDILINNAGLSMRAMFEDVDVSVIEKLMEVNFMGAVYMTKYALPSLIRSRGMVVGISSVAGYRATPGRTGYAASKFALNGFLESLRVELRPKRVKVITIAPGFIASNIRFKALDARGNITDDTKMNEQKMMTTERAALRILHVIRLRHPRVVFSVLGSLTIILNKISPTLTDLLVYKFYFRDGKLIK